MSEQKPPFYLHIVNNTKRILSFSSVGLLRWVALKRAGEVSTASLLLILKVAVATHSGDVPGVFMEQGDLSSSRQKVTVSALLHGASKNAVSISIM